MSEFWDNLVAIRPSLSAEQLAGWQPRRTAMQGLGCRLLVNRRIPVAPDVRLAADVYVPKVPGRYPAILQFAAYSKELHTAGIPTGSNEIGSPPVFKSDVGHGFLHFDMPVPPYFSRNTLHCGPDSYIELHRVTGPAQ